MNDENDVDANSDSNTQPEGNENGGQGKSEPESQPESNEDSGQTDGAEVTPVTPVTPITTGFPAIPIPPIPDDTAEKNKDRLWQVACHLAAFAGLLGAMKIPFGNILGPLVVWLLKKNEMPEVDDHGKESLNFQISMSIYMLVTVPFMFILIGFPALIALAIADVVFVIIAAIKTSNGEDYKYPYTIRLIK